MLFTAGRNLEDVTGEITEIQAALDAGTLCPQRLKYYLQLIIIAANENSILDSISSFNALGKKNENIWRKEMSDSIKAFETELKDNPEMLQKMKNAVNGIMESNAAIGEVEAFTMAAKTLGFDISVEGLMRSKADLQVLDDDELDAVAGGKDHDGEDENHCDSKYWCDVWYFHDIMIDGSVKDTTKVQCLAYYLCDHIFK